MRPTARLPLSLAALAVALVASAAFGAYVGRPQPNFTGHVSVGYPPHRAVTGYPYGGAYREVVTSADSGEIADLSSATVPTLYVSGFTQVGLAMTTDLPTAVVVLTPAYGVADADGNWHWHTGADVTLAADDEFTSQAAYTSNKAYVDTDGYPAMKVLVKSISPSASIQRLYARVN